MTRSSPLWTTPSAWRNARNLMTRGRRSGFWSKPIAPSWIADAILAEANLVRASAVPRNPAAGGPMGGAHGTDHPHRGEREGERKGRIIRAVDDANE